MNPLPLPVAESPLQEWHARHGAKFVERDGWRVPGVFSNVGDELAGARTGLALADLSPLAKLAVRGKMVAQIRRSLAPDSGPGKVVSLGAGLGWACFLTDAHCLLLSRGLAPSPLEAFAQQLPGYAPQSVFDATGSYAAIGLIGPRAEQLLSGMTSLEVGSLARGACAETALASVHATLIRPATSVPLLQVLVGWDVASFVWERLWEIGAKEDSALLGMDALDALWCDDSGANRKPSL